MCRRRSEASSSESRMNSLTSVPISAVERSGLKLDPLPVTQDQVRWLEEVLDAQNSKLEPLSSFVLPGGTQGAALLHVARTVVRRAEREVVEIGFQEPVTPAVIRYMNRLSNLLFVLARVENEEGRSEVLWEPGAHGSGRIASAAG